MIIVPELETVFILVPRTGSGTLYRELQRVYPKSMLLYRHMEADGVPQGYDRWRRVGFVRHPTMRLRSLYTFMATFTGGEQTKAKLGAAADTARSRRQVAGKTFEEWLITNDEPWTTPCDLNGEGAWWPINARRNTAPENKLSQFSYLRPDLGTEILKFQDLPKHMTGWGLDTALMKNKTSVAWQSISEVAAAHIARFCAWDLGQGCDPL